MKYKFIGTSKDVRDSYGYIHTVRQIECVKSFQCIDGRIINVGDKGGWIEYITNLSQNGNCWIFENCEVMDKSSVCDNSIVDGNVMVDYYAKITGDSIIKGQGIHIGFVLNDKRNNINNIIILADYNMDKRYQDNKGFILPYMNYRLTY